MVGKVDMGFKGLIKKILPPVMLSYYRKLKIKFKLKLKMHKLESFMKSVAKNKDNKVKLNEDNKEDANKPFKPIEGFSSNNKTYKDEAIERLKKLYEMVKSEFDNGKTELEILKQLAKLNLKI